MAMINAIARVHRITEITEKVTEISDEMTEITSVYVRLYVSKLHTKFHKDWCSFEKVMAIKLNL
jgi:hypothetical protein